MEITIVSLAASKTTRLAYFHECTDAWYFTNDSITVSVDVWRVKHLHALQSSAYITTSKPQQNKCTHPIAKEGIPGSWSPYCFLEYNVHQPHGIRLCFVDDDEALPLIEPTAYDRDKLRIQTKIFELPWQYCRIHSAKRACDIEQ